MAVLCCLSNRHDQFAMAGVVAHLCSDRRWEFFTGVTVTRPCGFVHFRIRFGRRKAEKRMSKSRHTEAQIIALLKRVDVGRTTEDVALNQSEYEILSPQE